MARKAGSWIGGVTLHEEADPWTAASIGMMGAIFLVPGGAHWYARAFLAAGLLTLASGIAATLLTMTAWPGLGFALALAAWVIDVADAPRACRRLNVRIRAQTAGATAAPA